MLTIFEQPVTADRMLPVKNAELGEATAIFAVNFYTPSMRLLQRHLAAKCFPTLIREPGLSTDLSPEEIAAARALYRFLESNHVSWLNIAGNSLPTLRSSNLTQAQVGNLLMRILRKIHAHRPFKGFVTGGRNGVEFSAAAAGVALGIPVQVGVSKGFLMAGLEGEVRRVSPDELESRINLMADGLRAIEPAP
ncbi:hypothetical protein CRM94_17470 [Burkholderia gladioli]|uniref:Uncharacterized protein n=1 Tax=Burkholderia gladioli TaxID=28095 RepID=A0A2A7SB51_BURGA|nr:hypothetical protein [Burkholderia gladioli]PEH40515.1 hypothetical protein CRM94_17470 [Burkholderia gladioli]